MKLRFYLLFAFLLFGIASSASPRKSPRCLLSVAEHSRVNIDLSHKMSGLSPINSRIAIHFSIKATPSDPQKLAEVIKIALASSTEPIVIFVPDSLNKFNEFVFNKKSLTNGSAEKKAIDDAEKFINLIQTAVFPLLGTQAKRIIIAKWNQIHSSIYQNAIDVLKDYYHSNQEFRRLIDLAAQSLFESRKHRGQSYTEERKLALVEQLFWELPSILNGIEVNGKVYLIAIHPTEKNYKFTDYSVANLVDLIRRDPLFEEIRNKIRLPKARQWYESFSQRE